MRLSIRCVSVIAVCMLAAASALAQYGGGGTGGGGMGGTGGYTAPKGGYSSSTGIAIGAAAAAGVGIAYFALHNRGKVVGCIVPSAAGKKLLDAKDQKTYTLLASNSIMLPPGQRLALKVKKAKDASGEPELKVQKVVKDYGSCKK
ncbi:MAG TPA: hypothetical protein VMX16_09135 [Terriglobia bacterium]|nr:hypothetical protein [Terriglobia bacterium]